MDLIQLHLKLQTNLENKKVTEKGEYYFAKCFKDVVSCAKKNRSSLINTQKVEIQLLDNRIITHGWSKNKLKYD